VIGDSGVGKVQSTVPIYQERVQLGIQVDYGCGIRNSQHQCGWENDQGLDMGHCRPREVQSHYKCLLPGGCRCFIGV
jgi:hypothetical protein